MWVNTIRPLETDYSCDMEFMEFANEKPHQFLFSLNIILTHDNYTTPSCHANVDI